MNNFVALKCERGSILGVIFVRVVLKKNGLYFITNCFGIKAWTR